VPRLRSVIGITTARESDHRVDAPRCALVQGCATARVTEITFK